MSTESGVAQHLWPEPIGGLLSHMIPVAVWVDAETKLLCAFVFLPGHEFIASATCLSILADAIEHHAGQALPEFIAFEPGFAHLGTLRRHVYYDALRSKLERAPAV